MTSLIDDLSDPDNYPDHPGRISLVQTHISMVFIGDAYVYKVKKPVNFGFLDFSTLEKRKYYCQQEVELNRRLSHDIYQGVLPIVFDGICHRLGEGRGEVIDYAVKMRKIPEDLLMKNVFEKGELREENLRDIARVLADFHQKAAGSEEIDRFGHADAFRINTDENFQQTEKYIGMTIEKGDFAAIRAFTNDFFQAHRDLFEERIHGKKIRDCHGDLHMEHVCLQDPIAVFDCIEFNDRFRYSDTLADIAFLLMDLEFNGGHEPAGKLWAFYAGMTQDWGMEPLLNFYKVYRAYVRGKVISFQLDDDHIGMEKKEAAASAAKRYFSLARAYVS